MLNKYANVEIIEISEIQIALLKMRLENQKYVDTSDFIIPPHIYNTRNVCYPSKFIYYDNTYNFDII